MRVHDFFRRKPLTSARAIADTLNVSAPTVTSALSRLQAIGIVEELSGRKWGRLYGYTEYLAILSDGTEPLR